MTILFAGGEDIDFTSLGTLATSVTNMSAYRRTDYSRCALQGAGASEPTSVLSNIFENGEITEGWFSVQAYMFADSGSWANGDILRICDATTEKGIRIRKSSGKAAITLFDGTTDTTLLTESSTSFSPGTAVKVDVYIKYAEAGIVRIYRAGTLIAEYLGDIRITGVTGLSRVGFRVTGSSYFGLSEFIVADEDTRLLSLKTLAPNAAGDVNQWTGAYTDIDEVTLSDADVIYTEAYDQDFQCNLTGMPTGDFIVKALVGSARMADGIGGIGAQLGIKTNSDVDLGDTVTLDGSWQQVSKIWQQNPITANRFTPAEIDALQGMVRSKEIV